MNHDDVEIRSASWLQPVLCPGGLKTEVARAVKALKQVEFDAIAFTGLSGAVLASAVALNMGKLLYCVRKADDKSRHSDYDVEGPLGALRYIIIDDLIQTGGTLSRIIQQVRKHSADCPATLVGIWLYRHGQLIMSPNDLKHYEN